MTRILRQLAKRIPFARAAWHAVRPKSLGERGDRRDTRLVARILPRILTPSACCVDVGAHTGVVLAEFIRLAPHGQHLAVEPIPALAGQLRAALPQVEVVNAALGDQAGETTFHLVETNPAFSGLMARADLRPSDRVVPIKVPIARLDDLVPSGRRITLMKIDVEGAELGVFRGARRVLGDSRPWVLFEHGLGAPSLYGTTPADVFNELAGHALAVWRLDQWLAGTPPLNLSEFLAAVNSGEYWNWLAGPAPAPSGK